MANLATTQHRLWRLQRNYEVLRNQRLVLETLLQAIPLGYDQGPWYSAADGLARKVAEQIYLTCDQIWQDSGLDPEGPR